MDDAEFLLWCNSAVANTTRVNFDAVFEPSEEATFYLASVLQFQQKTVSWKAKSVWRFQEPVEVVKQAALAKAITKNTPEPVLSPQPLGSSASSASAYDVTART